MWGALIGFLFLNPLLGIVAGAGLGAATGEVGDFGISHRFMNELATHLKPGSSALFIPLKRKPSTKRCVRSAIPTASS